MGEIADMMIDGTLDMCTGEYLGEAVGYPRTAKQIKKHNKKKRKQYKALSEKSIDLVTKEIENAVKLGIPLEEARRQANCKYGKRWKRRRLAINKDNQ